MVFLGNDCPLWLHKYNKKEYKQEHDANNNNNDIKDYELTIVAVVNFGFFLFFYIHYKYLCVGFQIKRYIIYIELKKVIWFFSHYLLILYLNPDNYPAYNAINLLFTTSKWWSSHLYFLFHVLNQCCCGVV